MKRFVVVLLLGLFLTEGQLPAQPAKPADKASGRYLFILETSSAMRRRADAVLDTVQSLLKSDLNGQLRPGDTLGVWTFNEVLHAGQFPLQTWSSESRDAVTLAVSTFLKIQRYEKQGLPECILADLERVIGTSEKITVLLVSAGEKEIPGPLFGAEVNATFTQWTREMQRTRMPFVTVLRAWKGEIVGRRVSMAPWPVTFPEFPPEPAPKVAAKPPPDVPPKKPATAPASKTRPPVILDMSQAAKATESLPATPAAPAPAQLSTPTLQVSPAPTEALKSDLSQPAPASPTVAASQTLTASPVPPAPPVSVPTPKPEPAVVPVTSPATATPPSLPEAKLAAPKVDTPETASSSSATGTAPVLQESAPPAPSSPPSQVAVTVPLEPMFTGKTLMVGGAALLLVVALLMVYLRRRATAHASLITRSMDRKPD